VNVWAADLKRGRNDANKHGSSKQLKARKYSGPIKNSPIFRGTHATTKFKTEFLKWGTVKATLKN